MKAFLLAAGHGERLRPLTDKIPKCLLPIRGVPLLQIWLQNCARYGIREVLVNVHAHAQLIREFLSMCDGNSDIHVVEEAELLGSAGTILKNRDWIDPDEYFWVFYADVLCRLDFAEMLRLHESRRPAATIGVYRVPDPGRCGIVEATQDGTVVNFVEKPSRPRSNFAFSGVLLGTRSLLDAIPRKHPVDLGFDVLPRLTGKMVAYPISSYVLDIGTKENYQLAQSTWPGLDD